MQVVINKCFLLNPEKKIGANPSCHFQEKCKNAPLIPKNDVTEPKVRLLYYQLKAVNRLNNSFRLPETIRKSETDL